MKENKSMLAICMGVIIIIVDLYWTYTSYSDSTSLALGLIILVASLVWIGLDWNMSMKPTPMTAAK